MKQSTRLPVSAPSAADREQAAPVTDDLHLVGRTQVLGRFGSPLDGRFREKGRIFGRIDDTLHAPVELRSQRSRIGGDGDPQVGIAPQQVGGQQGRSPDALAVLGRHGDDQPADARRQRMPPVRGSRPRETTGTPERDRLRRQTGRTEANPPQKSVLRGTSPSIHLYS